MALKKAQRKASKFKCSIQGASGSGKTYSALKIATALVTITDPGKRIALIDTENSAELYSPPFDFDVDDDFGVGLNVSYKPDTLIAKMEEIRKAGVYGAVIVDSATYFWKEAGGFTSMIDAICDAQRARGGKGDSFAAWKQVDPLYRKLMTYIRNYPLHVFLCIRAKQAYERDTDAKGKGSLRKVGMEPEFRDGFEFLMDAQFAITEEGSSMVPLKHRLGEFLSGKVFKHPGEDVAQLVANWIDAGAPGQEVTPPAPAAAPPAAPAPAANDTAVEEPAPPTAKNPATEPSIPAVAPSTPAVAEQSAADALLAKLLAASNEAELKAAAGEIKSSLKDKKITPEEYNSVLSPAYAQKNKELKAA